jgi:eukaryotic-like serine/threonine-protein kinase
MARRGEIVSTTNSARPLKLGPPFPPGGQGTVFPVEGQPLVVKLYHPSLVAGSRGDTQRLRLATLVREGPPSSAFAWPLDLIEQPELGYVMARAPQHFVSLQQFNWQVNTWDWRVRLRICFRLAQALATLHLRGGYAYCDLSSSNVLCDPSSGEVRLIDVDNLTVDGHRNALGVLGTPRYVAPELYIGSVPEPSILTDLHSLAVLIFETLLLHHPLLGDRVLQGPPELEERALGARPIYIYHPTDRSNRFAGYRQFGGLPPSVLPPMLRRTLTETFTKGLDKPQLRVRETRWQRVLADSLDILVRCPRRKCSLGGSFLDSGSGPTICAGCGSVLNGFRVMHLYGRRREFRRAKVLAGSEWLASHHCKLNALFDFSPGGACGKVELDAQYGLTLQNTSQETFLYRPPGDALYAPFSPGKKIALRPGTRVQFGAGGAEGHVVA